MIVKVNVKTTVLVLTKSMNTFVCVNLVILARTVISIQMNAQTLHAQTKVFVKILSTITSVSAKQDSQARIVQPKLITARKIHVYMMVFVPVMTEAINAAVVQDLLVGIVKLQSKRISLGARLTSVNMAQHVTFKVVKKGVTVWKDTKESFVNLILMIVMIRTCVKTRQSA